MDNMSSPLDNGENSQESVQSSQPATFDPVVPSQPAVGNDDDDLRIYANRLDNNRLDNNRLRGRSLDPRLTQDPLDSHIGDEEISDNKLDNLKIERRVTRKPSEESILDDLKIIIPPRITDYTTLLNFFHSHIIEMRFTRRHDKQGYNPNRRMVCTANWKYLSSMFTRRIFNWKTPKTRRGVSWYKRRGLMIVWDLMIKDFRIIPVGGIKFVSAYKCTSLIEKGRFYLFYRKQVGTLTESQQKKYFNS